MLNNWLNLLHLRVKVKTWAQKPLSNLFGKHVPPENLGQSFMSVGIAYSQFMTENMCSVWSVTKTPVAKW